MKKVCLYLISDSTGETVVSVAKSAFAHFKDVIVEEHLWVLFRTEEHIKKLKLELEKKPGIVMYTLVDSESIEKVREVCRENKVPCIPVLAKIVAEIQSYLQMDTINQPGRQHALNEQYFSRIDAINYALSHDDGQAPWGLEEADIILVGPSRTSKSPTCMYLAYRGYKSANIPYVKTSALPDNIFSLTKPLIIGLTINVENLMHIRKNRLKAINNSENLNYADEEKIREEIKESRSLYARCNWPIVDVTRSSVEETAARIIQLYEIKKNREK
jgi:[pyruvate, water dikinase]-phosphate phosphotransferase / [pyruvate, water dikinase] kinase